MKKIFITATNTNIGKTYTTQKLLHALAKKGRRVGALKPIETGVATTPPDGALHLQTIQKLNQDAKHLTIDDVVPITYKQPAAPFIAAKAKEIDLHPVFEAMKRFEDVCDVLLIEGAGGLHVPINKEYMMIDLIDDIAPDAVLLVSHCSLGCINDTLLSYKALQNRGHKVVTAFNCKGGDDFERTSKPYFDAANFPTLQVDEDIDEIAKILLQ